MTIKRRVARLEAIQAKLISSLQDRISHIYWGKGAIYIGEMRLG